MYRFLLRPKWIGFHLLVVAGIVAMINLGFWQLRRLDQREAFNATIEARYDAAPVPLGSLLAPDADPAAIEAVEWRPATVTGTYLAEQSLRVVNRSQGGRPGENVVVPLLLDDGRVLLVNRGFIPLTDIAPAAPGGEVEITGRIRPSERRRTAQLSDPAEGVLTEAQRVDLDRLAAQFEQPLAPVYLDMISSVPPDGDPYPERVARPELTEGSHLSYAVQWIIFAVALGVGWVLAVRRSIATHRRQRAVTEPPAASSS